MNNAPIGIFDSGLGGLTVAQAVVNRLPNEEIIYLADTVNTPYGPRPMDEVRDLTLAGLDALVRLGAKALVIACNTATVAAFDDARNKYWAQNQIPVVEVISPTARAALETTRSGRIGVIGTVGTIESQVYPGFLGTEADVEVFSAACPRFVEFVEQGITSGEELTKVAAEYLGPIRDQNVDTLVLGCTHYPLLADVIKQVLGNDVQLVSSSPGTAEDLAAVVGELDLSRGPRSSEIDEADAHFQLFTTSNSPQFPTLARRFLGKNVQSVETITTS